MLPNFAIFEFITEVTSPESNASANSAMLAYFVCIGARGVTPNVYVISDSFLFVKRVFEIFYVRANFFHRGAVRGNIIFHHNDCGCLKLHGILSSEPVEFVKSPFVSGCQVTPNKHWRAGEAGDSAPVVV